MFPALKLEFQDRGVRVKRGKTPFEPIDQTQTSDGTFLCSWPLACFAAWAMPAAVSQRSHQPVELMFSNEIQARVARRVLLSVAW